MKLKHSLVPQFDPITFMTFLSRISCCASAPCSSTVQPRGRGHPLKNSKVRGPEAPYFMEPAEFCELPLLFNRRKGVVGVPGCLSGLDLAALLSIREKLPCSQGMHL